MDRSGGERGATAVAYAMMVAILTLLLVGSLVVLSGGIDEALNNGANCVADPADCGDGAGTGTGGGPGNGGGGSTTTTNSSSSTTTTTTTGP